MVNILTYSFNEYEIDVGSVIENAFKMYAEKNSLNITVNVDVMRFPNPTSTYKNFKLLVETSLKKSNNIHTINNKNLTNTKYDIYFYDMRFTDLYAPYLLDLNEVLPKDFIEKYNSRIINESCIYEDKVVGLVIIICELFYNYKLIMLILHY